MTAPSSFALESPFLMAAGGDRGVVAWHSRDRSRAGQFKSAATGRDDHGQSRRADRLCRAAPRQRYGGRAERRPGIPDGEHLQGRHRRQGAGHGRRGQSEPRPDDRHPDGDVCRIAGDRQFPHPPGRVALGRQPHRGDDRPQRQHGHRRPDRARRGPRVGDRLAPRDRHRGNAGRPDDGGDHHAGL